MPKQTAHIYYLDILRILAIMAVVMIHMQFQWYALPITSYKWAVSTFLDSACRWCVPIFFMISGTLFINPDRPLEIRTIYTHNILRLVTAYLFWSLIYALSNHPDSLNTFTKDWLQGPFHFWFFFPMICVYMFLPITKIIALSEYCKYYLVLGLLFTILLPPLVENITILFPDIYQNPFFISLYVDYHKMVFYPVLGFNFYFILGYVISTKTFSPKISLFIKLMLPIGIALTYSLTKAVSIKTGSANELFFDYFSFPVLLESIGIFELAKTLPISFSNSKLQKIIIELSKYTFGIFLVHILVFHFLQAHFRLDLIPFPRFPFIIWPIVYVISLIISMILNHVPILNKYIL